MSKTLSYQKFELGSQFRRPRVDFFNKYGFIHYKNFITPERAQTVSAAIDEKQKEIIAKGIQKINVIPIKFGEDENSEPIIQRFLHTSRKTFLKSQSYMTTHDWRILKSLYLMQVIRDELD
ncbi:MAG: hypothetical protein IPI10_18455 [Bacteroidetes bacterium]|nr:hypothetical protein [Bacteroidota bacterium]